MNHAPWALLLLAGVALVAHAYAYGFVCDDAYISFRYSFNLAHHGELSFNLGERVEGYTNFLWTVLLALFMKLGLRPEPVSQALGAAFGLVVLTLVVVLTRLYRGGRPRAADALGALFLASWGGFAVWCSGGLETQMFSALGLAGMTLYLAERAGLARSYGSGVLFALSAMTRPEGLLLFGLTGLHRFSARLRRGKLLPGRADLSWGLAFVLPFGAFFAWRFSYYGHPLPNTFYAKAESGWSTITRWGLPYLWDWIQLNRLYLLAPLLLVFRPATAGHGFPEPDHGPSEPPMRPGLSPGLVWSYLALVFGTYVAYVTYVGGDFMAMGRFFVPVMPLVAFFAQEGLREAVGAFPYLRRRGFGTSRPPRACPLRTRLAFGLGLLVVLAGALNSVHLHRINQEMPYLRSGMETIAYLHKFAADRLIVGRWMREHLPPDTYYSVGGAGASVYASRLKALDVFGLTNEWVAHNVKAGPGGRPGHAKAAPLSYVLSEKPDLLCHAGHHQDWLFRPSRADASAWRARGYTWVCLSPQGLRPQFYCCLKRLDRDLGSGLIEATPR